ncbi:hypothetical protein ACFW9F_19625 [Streptomyces sp. NPDC059506]|uniref:hypothetical protein n=1 Tax=Streptomyces sp. NPDC059506 TaxID=3347751 RepID=UPI0036CEDCA3
MVTIRQLEKLKFGALEEAEESWRESSARLDYHREEVDRSMRAPLKEHWKGSAADSAQSRMSRLSGNFANGAQQCGLIRRSVKGAVSELRVEQKKLQAALDEADSHGFTVDDDGRVSPKNPDAVYSEDVAARKELAMQDIADRIAEAVKLATEIDERYRNTLMSLRPEDGLKVDRANAAHDAKGVDIALPSHLQGGGPPSR